MQDSNELLALALQLAVTSHGNVVGKDLELYIKHPIRVMLKAKPGIEQIVAILHDVVEDTDVTLLGLYANGFPSTVVDAVDALTRRKDESYSDFIERVCQNRVAINVKMLDIEDNLNVLRLPKIGVGECANIRRYHDAYRRLQDAVLDWSMKK